AWNRHTGQPTLFGAPSRPAQTATTDGSAPGTTGAPGTGSGVPTPAVAGAGTGAGAASMPTAPAAAPTAAAPTTEQVVITTDVVKATFDSAGGTLVRLELLGYRDPVDPQRNVVLFDRQPKRLYLAQTGLITGQAGVQLPNHLTAMTVAPGERALAA